jgi:hypothetical protein
MNACISCGMPMRETADYPLGDESKDYCVHCARPDGSLQSYPERLDGMAGFLVRTQGLDPVAARETAARQMATMPAWHSADLG